MTVEGRMIKTWRIAQCGWNAYFAEVAALSRGRLDVKIECWTPGVLSLVECEIREKL